jgi:hypothetical protein
MSRHADDYTAHGILKRVEEWDEIVGRHGRAECLLRLFYRTVERAPDSHRELEREAPL